MQDACKTAGLEVARANKMMEALQIEVAGLTGEREGLDKQLHEALQQIANLEAEMESRIAKQNELESRVNNLEKELITAWDAHTSVSTALILIAETRCS